MCRSWEGAQPGSQPKLAHRNIPYHWSQARFKNAQYINGSQEFFLWVWQVPWAQHALQKPRVPCLLLGDWLCNQLSGNDKNCTMYHLFCILFIIMPSFVVLLNCLYLSPWVLLFSSSLPHPTVQGKGRVSGCLVLSCGLKPQHKSTQLLHSNDFQQLVLKCSFFFINVLP